MKYLSNYGFNNHNIMRYIITFLILILTCVIHTQTPILPISKIQFDSEEFIWSAISEDTTIADGIKYNGITHLTHFNNYKLVPIEHEGYFYIVDMSGLYGIEGSVVSKIDKKSGERVWYKTFDLRTNPYHEYPVSFHINSENELVLFSQSSKNIYAKTRLIYLLESVPVYWNIKKINLASGEVVFDKRVEASDLEFRSNGVTLGFTLETSTVSNIFETCTGYTILMRSLNKTTEYYKKINLDNSLNITARDTIYLNLPNFKNENIYLGFRKYGDEYCSLDIKKGYLPKHKPRYYNLYFWDEGFNITDSIPQFKLEQLFGDIPNGYSIDYYDDQRLLISTTSKNINGENVIKIIETDRKGNLLNTFPLTNRSYPVYNKSNNCTVLLSQFQDNADRYGVFMYSVCDSNQLNIRSYTIPPNLSIFTVNGIITEDSNILLTTLQSKDTIINGDRRRYYQSVAYLLFKGEKLGLTSGADEVESVRKPFVLYPNPTSSTLQIVTDMDYDHVLIHSIDGKITKQETVSDGAVNVSFLPNDAYICTLIKGGRIISSGVKFVKVGK